MKVRITLRPDVELDVDEAEYLDLERQGILLPGYEGPDIVKRPVAVKSSEKKEG